MYSPFDTDFQDHELSQDIFTKLKLRLPGAKIELVLQDGMYDSFPPSPKPDFIQLPSGLQIIPDAIAYQTVYGWEQYLAGLASTEADYVKYQAVEIDRRDRQTRIAIKTLTPELQKWAW